MVQPGLPPLLFTIIFLPLTILCMGDCKTNKTEQTDRFSFPFSYKNGIPSLQRAGQGSTWCWSFTCSWELLLLLRWDPRASGLCQTLVFVLSYIHSYILLAENKVKVMGANDLVCILSELSVLQTLCLRQLCDVGSATSVL